MLILTANKPSFGSQLAIRRRFEDQGAEPSTKVGEVHS
jgi:hypothetical protein